MRAALRVEMQKLVRSLVGTVTSLTLVLGTVSLLAGITAGVRAGQEELVAQVGPAGTATWDGLLLAAAQIISAGGLLGAGVLASWLMAREFVDGTISALFVLPVGLGRIAAAKLLVLGLWAMVVSLSLGAAVLALGVMLGYGAPDDEAWVALCRQVLLVLSSALLATPAAWAATLGRSLLAGVGATVGLLVVAQVGALTGAGPWIPFAAPALWAMTGGAEVSAAQLSLSVMTGLLFAALTVVACSRLQLNR